MKQLEIDCRGMQCPAPILQVATAAREVAAGPALLYVFANDADFRVDLEAWCRAAQADVRWEPTDREGTFHAVVGLNGASTLGSPPVHSPPAPSPPRPPAPASARPAVARPVAAPPAEPPPRVAPTVLDLTGVPAHMAVLQLTSAAREAPAIQVRCDDPNFQAALYAWASATRAEVRVDVAEGAGVVARVRLPEESRSQSGSRPRQALVRAPSEPLEVAPKRATLLVLRNDLESLLGALLSANAFASQGLEVVMYFSFWGVNLLRGRNPRERGGRRSIFQRLMQWLMPRGPRRQRLGKLHLGGLGTGLMRRFMRRNHVLSLEELLEQAVEQRVRFQVCTMSMGVMGIRKGDLMDLPNLEYAGVTSFAESASRSSVSLTF